MRIMDNNNTKMQAVPSYSPSSVPADQQRCANNPPGSNAVQSNSNMSGPMIIDGTPVAYMTRGGGYYVVNNPPSPVPSDYEVVYGAAVQQMQSPMNESKGDLRGQHGYPVSYQKPYAPSEYSDKQGYHPQSLFGWRSWVVSLVHVMMFPCKVLFGVNLLRDDAGEFDEVERLMQYEESIENELDRRDTEQRLQAWERIDAMSEESVKLAAIQAEVSRSATYERNVIHRREYRAQERRFYLAERSKYFHVKRADFILRTMATFGTVASIVAAVRHPLQLQGQCGPARGNVFVRKTAL